MATLHASLQVPGYDDDDDVEPTIVPPLSNPPLDHPLVTQQYDSLDALVEDLHEWGAQALFGIRRLCANNYVKGFGYTRVDFCCSRDKIRPCESFTRRQSSTTKTRCLWLATTKALASNDRKWSSQIREGIYNHSAAEGREAIPSLHQFKPEHVAFVAIFVNRHAVTNRQVAEAIRN